MDTCDGSNKVIRAQTLRRGKNDERLCDRIKLKKVLGLTVYSNAALDVSPTTGILAYPAGCTVVLFNAKKLSQSYLLNTARKAITSVAYSKCGRYIATGECGINPAIKVWELDSQYAGGNNNVNSNINTNSNIPTTGDTNNAGGTVVAEFLGHKYAVSCVAFSPTGKYLVSVGSQHDMIVNVFDWKLNLKIASNKVSAKVAAVCFSEDGNYFVTVGNRHVKYWYLEGGRKYKEPIPLMGRSAILGELRNNDFCAVACGKGDCSESTYAITRVGHLVEFNSRRLLDKWVACRTTSANCICVNTNYILVGCAEAIVRIFNAATLEYITTLPRTHYLGVDVAQGIHINHIMTVPPSAKYPDTIAMVYDEGRSKVTCIYNDHSLYVWDLRDVKRVGKSHSFLYHSACIWGVETVPYNFETNNIQHQHQQQQTLPEDCFVTCSSDDTIRVWGLEDCDNNEVYRKNIYSKDLLKVVYIDDELNYIKDVDNPIIGNDKSSSYDGRNGVRCIKINPDKSHLASGDRSGNIRIYSLNHLKLITMIEAHDSEVLCLEYTNEKIEKKLLASASRDRLIHVFDVNQGYKILQTLDDHSSSITSVKFIGGGLNFQMISCGADKSIMFRQFQNNQFQRGTNCSGKATLYDMEVDSNSKHILTACQDRNIRVYGTQNAKHTKTFKGSHSDDGSLIKLCLDFSGIYIATSCTDKTLSVYDYYSNECMARMYGHSELVTGLKFTNDCKYLISASGDGCIFIWQVPHDMIVTMQARLSQQRMRSGHPPLPRPISNPVADVVLATPVRADTPEKLGTSPSQLFPEEITLTPGYKLSEVGQLPQWAKRKTGDDVATSSMPHVGNSGSISVPPAVNLSSSPNQNQMIMPRPRGRWAQRGQIDSDILDLRSTSESPLSTAYNAQTSDYNSGSSKDIYNQAYLSEDSSIDSGLENRRDIFIPKLVPEQKKISNLRFEANNDNDGDVEDISDGERTSSDHGMVFYPIPVPGTPTDFKVNAMNEEELRKSVRRQKFEKSGLHLTVATISHGGASTGTGTGTSDTEDEGSTPSGENAERSLASTLGGSSENIPQQSSSSFLQAALDGPGHLPERNDKSRRSISAKHNTESKSTTGFPKSYTNRKKEELMKVISEAKQKLENVGYRSSLRGSQSISDLSYMGGNSDNGRSRFQRTGESFPNTTNSLDIKNNGHHSSSSNYYFNCAAPRSVLAHNCNAIRQLHRNYPPYPRDIGVSQNKSNVNNTNTQSHPPMIIKEQKDIPDTTKVGIPSRLQRPVVLEIPSLEDNSHTETGTGTTLKPKRHTSILKNYKSCPVSPVHEELEWSNFPIQTKPIVFHDSKRHSMYSDDAKTILDMIHSDTEKMIQEITKKYGDLDNFQTAECSSKFDEASSTNPFFNTPKVFSSERGQMKTSISMQLPKTEKNEFKFLEEEGNFSSDSLEDCSLDLDVEKKATTNPFRKKKSTCKKHHRKTENKDYIASSAPPKRSVSDYFIYEEFYKPQYKNVSLSDILNEGNESGNDKNNEDADKCCNLLGTKRHSSASFFLAQYPENKSQESILSDDFSGISYYNSMESILSDESDCKSAPLEILFNKTKKDKYTLNAADKQGEEGNYAFENVESASKSYGSSPNTTSNFDFYMQQKCMSREPRQFDITGYSLDEFYDIAARGKPTTNRVSNLPTSVTYPKFFPHVTDFSLAEDDHDPDDIPTLRYKNAQYTSTVNKSLSREFANQRQINNSNPLYIKVDNTEPNSVKPMNKFAGKPAIPAKPAFLQQNEDSHAPPGSSSNSCFMRKSCSFEINMIDTTSSHTTQHHQSHSINAHKGIVGKRFERNLEMFEKDQEKRHEVCQMVSAPTTTTIVAAKSTLEMNYVPHKPPVAARRAASMRSRNRSQNKERYNTVDQIQYTPIEIETVDGVSSSIVSSSEYQRDFVNRDFLAKQEQKTKKTSSNVQKASEEKSYEIYISETATNDNDNMDSLELYTKPSLRKDNSIDSLDEPTTDKHMKNSQNEKSSQQNLKDTSLGVLSSEIECKFRDIEKKIDIVNKLIELEEKKLEQERMQKELRMKPFECNSNQKGYVKSLTLNFDKLAERNIEENLEYARSLRQLSNSETGKMKRNYSLPDVLEGAKFQVFDTIALDGNDFTDAESEKIKDDFAEKDQGNPKSFMSVHIDDSSIRRACSLSDLSMGKGPKPSGPPLPSAQQKASTTNRQSVPPRNSGKRSNSVVPKITTSTSNGMGSRSTSVGVLNQSDSETDSFQGGSSMRPNQGNNRVNGTSSNSRAYGTKNTPPNSSRRKGLQNSYSSVNLSMAPHDDSSSEETPSSITHNVKPILPPRPRSSANTAKMKEAFEILNKMEIENESANADLTSNLCANIICTLNKTTNAVLQLHTRLKEESSDTRNNNLMLKELENAVIMTQNMLTKIINNKTEKNSPESPCPKYEHKAYEAMAKIDDIINQVKSINYKLGDVDEDEMKRSEK